MATANALGNCPFTMDIELIRTTLHRLEHSFGETRTKKGVRIKVDNGVLISVSDDGTVSFGGKDPELLRGILTTVEKISGRGKKSRVT